ncbi:hypothetical protein NQ317_009409 [Molorchus minor]|uniref:Uncharacterized protein n=1 Tax=Molorchus minor TaxID=1323400 RepID=A0ABQ9JR28_9CUCU|nr:hypothetical protein NQ317_009409 [Molorchus minor]
MMALTDLLGGYLQHAVLPIARQAYYAGILEYSSMERLMQLYEELKWFLRTNGQGWATPTDKETDFDIQSIDLNTETSKCNKSSCRNLIYYRHEPSKKRSATDTDTARYFFPIPFLDAKVHPTAIAVPFKKFALRNIESKKAAHLVMKFFIAVEMCFKDAHACEETVTKFHNNLYTWIEKEVIPKLKDDKFYSAFGGILRVEETLKSLGATVNEEKAVEEEGEEELGAVPGGETTSRSRTVLMAMLIIIFVWFIIGTLFICYRMRANNLKGRPCKGPKSDGTCSTTTGSRWSLLTRSSSRKMSSETCKCCSSTEKSTTKRSSNTSEPTTQSSEQEEPQKDSKRLSFSSPCVCDGYAIIDTKHSMKLLPSIPELSENSTVKKQSSKTRKITFDAAATMPTKSTRETSGKYVCRTWRKSNWYIADSRSKPHR